MKKKLLTFVTVAIMPIAIFAQSGKQIKKSSPKTVSSPKVEILPEERAKNNAEKWFREIYVDKFFKDPYSYKLLKLTSEKVSVKQSLIDSLSYLDGEIIKYNITEKDATQENRALWQKSYDKVFLSLKTQQEKLKGETDANQIDLLNKLIAIDKKYALKYLDGLKNLDLYFLMKDEKSRIQEKLISITPKQEESLAFYKIKIDCYSKNSVGNEILGRFQFPFTESGTIGSGDGFDTVVQLNKPD